MTLVWFCVEAKAVRVKKLVDLPADDLPADYLIIETTGLADPLPIMLTFLRTELRDRVRIDSVITLADAENFSLDLIDNQAARKPMLFGLIPKKTARFARPSLTTVF